MHENPIELVLEKAPIYLDQNFKLKRPILKPYCLKYQNEKYSCEYIKTKSN